MGASDGLAQAMWQPIRLSRRIRLSCLRPRLHLPCLWVSYGIKFLDAVSAEHNLFGFSVQALVDQHLAITEGQTIQQMLTVLPNTVLLGLI